MKIAIVGAGIAGLASAHYLRSRHELTVSEASAHVGGHARTARGRAGGGEFAANTGFVVFNEANYPLFTRLPREPGVETRSTSMSFSVRSDRSGIEYNGSSIDGLLSQRPNLLRPRFLRMPGDIAHFQIEAPTRALGVASDTSVESFAAAGGYGPGFVQDYLTPPGKFRKFPIRFVVEFLANHGMPRWKGRPA